MKDATLEMLQAVWQLDEGLQRLSRSMLSHVGVTGPQRLVLRLIEQNPDITANEIARTMHLNRSTVSGIIQRLEAEGYLTRQVSEEDARSRQLSLTKAGWNVVRLREGTIEAAVQNLAESLPPTRLKTAMDVMRDLASQLEQQRLKHQS